MKGNPVDHASSVCVAKPRLSHTHNSSEGVQSENYAIALIYHTITSVPSTKLSEIRRLGRLEVEMNVQSDDTTESYIPPFTPPRSAFDGTDRRCNSHVTEEDRRKLETPVNARQSAVDAPLEMQGDDVRQSSASASCGEIRD